MAETDPLTGLANRRKFTADFDRLRRMATRYHQPLSFALLDLDKFKRVNDTYGHTDTPSAMWSCNGSAACCHAISGARIWSPAGVVRK